MNELTRLTITEASQLIAERRLSPVELVKAHLGRMEALNPQINAYITITAEQALQQARQAEAEVMRGEHRGALHGIPIGLKDLFETAGVVTTAGTAFWRNNIPERDGFVVEKLKAAGAVILGKLNLHEIALGVLTDNPHYGFCHNPWDVARSPGGSSGGSGAALAAEMCMGAMGSDTRGSIRIPAAWCGVVGMKPTYGRISVRGVIPLSYTLDHAGPMARRVADVARLLEAIEGYDAADPFALPSQPAAFVQELTHGFQGMRIGIAQDSFFTDVDDETLAAFEQVGAVFTRLGAVVQPIDLGFMAETVQTSRVIVSVDAAAFHAERIASQPHDFGADVLGRLKLGLGISSADYSNARRSQVVLRHQFEQLFREVDVVITPTLRMPAVRFDDAAAVEQARASLSYTTAPFNMVGAPTISLPCGFTADGLPIGLQIAGRAWNELDVLRAAYAYEQATDWHLRRPPINAD